ncbi:MAG: hypothetical protein ACM3ML_37000, partial [Micromonosporaceae bacterium]
DNPLAVDIFALNLLLASLATQATLILGRRKDLLMPQADAQARQAARIRVTTMVIIIVSSIGIAWVNASAARYCWLLTAVVPRAANRWSARHTA